MKKYNYVLIIAVMISLMAITNESMAQTKTKRTDVRQHAQRARIVEGKRSGEVTQGEAALLKGEQRHIRRAERRAKSDGEVTGKEKLRLERKQDRASRHIRKAKHNGVDNNQ
ncbi:MAG: hypothetical protein KF860_16825 [Cyclobacteriaceae bacterium]|nr:hypothetical protein [Cyclobacteriaceae bacterium]